MRVTKNFMEPSLQELNFKWNNFRFKKFYVATTNICGRMRSKRKFWTSSSPLRDAQAGGFGQSFSYFWGWTLPLVKKKKLIYHNESFTGSCIGWGRFSGSITFARYAEFGYWIATFDNYSKSASSCHSYNVSIDELQCTNRSRWKVYRLLARYKFQE